MQRTAVLWRLGALGALAVLLVALNWAPVWASMCGEENATLVKIVVELVHAKKELEKLNKAAEVTAGMTRDLVRTYQKMNAGVDELRAYTWGKFWRDLKKDFYNQYPGFGELEYASKNLERWANTRTSSPFTAYEAISAVVGDVAGPLRDDVADKRVNMDEDLVLKGEAAGGFALANEAEEATKDFDDDAEDLAEKYALDPSPGSAQMVTAETNLILAAQSSHIIRLLSRAVRLDSVDKALAYGARLRAKKSAHERRDATRTIVEEALTPPAMIQFDEVWP